jgi:two-component system, LuxR family, sensor kinase FixL
MPPMKDLARLTKAELIERLNDLEAKAVAENAASEEEVGTRQELAGAALRDTAERLRAILQTAAEGIITIDERGVIESFNPAAEKIFAYEALEVIGENVAILMPAPYREEHDSYMGNYLRTGHAKIIGIGREILGRRRDGSVFPMDLAVSEVRLADRRLFTGFVRDITERKRLESEILEISDREQRRIGQDLHDGLCQHLAGIELMSQVAAQKLAAKSKSDAARVDEIAKLVREAISQTRLLARGLSPVMRESEGLMSALQELAASTERLFGVGCMLECDSPVLVHDHTVATHLYRIAQEAVSNAIKHGKARKITIRLKAAGEKYVLSVKDSGVGLPKIISNKNGMGLRIMEYRARMVSGALMVERDLNGGTSVICSVPRSQAVERANQS